MGMFAQPCRTELNNMNSDRIKEIQEATAYPESVSVKQALLQVWNECAQEQVKSCSIPAVIKSLPEYNEILYHARTLTDEQFREYWNEVQGNVL